MAQIYDSKGLHMVNETDECNMRVFGFYQSRKRTHKRHLRTHHLGKFAKRK